MAIGSVTNTPYFKLIAEAEQSFQKDVEKFLLEKKFSPDLKERVSELFRRLPRVDVEFLIQEGRLEEVEPLVAILKKCDLSFQRYTAMALLMPRIHSDLLAIELFSRFEWTHYNIVNFVQLCVDAKEGFFDIAIFYPILRQAVEPLSRSCLLSKLIEMLSKRLNSPCHCPQEAQLRHEAPSQILALFKRFEWNDEGKADFFSSCFIGSQWSEEIKDCFTHYFFNEVIIESPLERAKVARSLRCMDPLKLIDHFKYFAFPNDQVKLEILKSAIKYADNEVSLRAIEKFEDFEIESEAARAEIVEILAGLVPDEVTLFFPKFGIEEDRNKSKIVIELFHMLSERMIPNLQAIRFSENSIEIDAYRKGLDKNYVDLEEVIGSTSNLSLLKVCVESLSLKLGIAASFEKVIFPLVDGLKKEHDQLRALRWLGEIFLQLRGAKIPLEILNSRQVVKMFAALMMLRNPTVRNMLGAAYTDLLKPEKKTAFDSFAKRQAKKDDAVFNSKFYQPLRDLSLPSSFLTNCCRLKGAEGLLHLPDSTELSEEQRISVERVFQSYQSYRALHSPENFDSQMLHPALKLLKGQPSAAVQTFKRELCGFIENRTQFDAWLKGYAFPITVEEGIRAVFKKYKDAPRKYNFSFVELYYDLMGFDMSGFAKAAYPTFDLFYFPLLEALNEVYRYQGCSEHFARYGKGDAEDKSALLEKLHALFLTESGSSIQRKSSPEKLRRVEEELCSLITVLLFVKENQMLLRQSLKAPSFSDYARKMILTTFRLKDDQNVIDKFHSCFLNNRMNGLFPAYAVKLQMLCDMRAMQALVKAVHSVLNGTYASDRVARSPQLDHLREVRPDIYERWKNIQHSSTFALSADSSSSFAFDPSAFLYGKLIIDKHMDIQRFPQLERVLQGKVIEGEGVGASSSSGPCLQEILINLARAKEKEEQIALLQSLQQYPLGESFLNDIEGALRSFTVQTKESSLLTLTTSTQYLDTFLGGTEVFGSCQHLAKDVFFSKCVPAFHDGKFLPLLIQDEEGIIVSRAFLIMEFDENDAPILFLERFYTRNQDPLLVRKTEQLAVEIARDLGLSLVKKNYNVENRISKYSEGAPFTGRLKSYGNGWGPYEYSDAGGGVKDGPYTFASDMYGNLEYL